MTNDDVEIAADALAGGRGEGGDEALGQAREILVDAERAVAVRHVGIGGAIIDDDQVEIGGRGHFAAAELAHGEHDGRAAPDLAVRLLHLALDDTGEQVHQNFGYSARSVTPAILLGNVASEIYIEKEKYIRSTNVHFTVPISDAQYRAILAEVKVWGSEPGRGYNLDRHNCIHFVAKIAELVGLKAPVPADLVRKPKHWLNYITALNPQLGARVLP